MSIPSRIVLVLASLGLSLVQVCRGPGAAAGPVPIGSEDPQLPDDVLVPSAAALAAIADETGWDELNARLGGAVPTGAGEVVAFAEATSGGSYGPDLNHPEFAGKNIVLKSGSTGVSSHATVVGQHFFGTSTGISPGMTEVRCYSATSFLGSGFLKTTALINPPKTVNWRVQNNSWIGSGDDAYLLKYDYAIEEQDIFVASGVNNGTGPLDVPLFSHLYNGIAVGRSDGNHHAGGTLFGYGTNGRQKPELVAPAGATSYATPLVAGAAALLLETAKTHLLLAMNPNAQAGPTTRPRAGPAAGSRPSRSTRCGGRTSST